MSRSCITDKGSGMQPPKPQFKVGDKVRIIGNGNNHKQPIGKIVTLCEIHNRSMVSAEFASLGKPWGIEESCNTTLREQDIELAQPTKKEFVVGKWYKCVEGASGAGLQLNNYYKLIDSSTVSEGLRFAGSCDGCYWSKLRFDITSESDYDPNSTKYIPEIEDKVVAKDVEDAKLAITGEAKKEDFVVVCKGSFFDKLQNHLVINQSGNNATTSVGDVNMSNSNGNLNRVVSVKFFDDDTGLKAENSLVASYEITTRANDAMTVNKLLMREDIAGDIDMHNAVRASTVDATILKNTGNKVFLQPIDFEDLRVVVSNV